MTVTIEEIKTPASFGTFANSSVALTTTLLSTDLIVIVLSSYTSGTTTITVNGSAPTLAGTWSSSAGTSIRVWTKTGLTGSHSVAYTTNSGAFVNLLTIFVVRGLNDPGVYSTSASTFPEGSITTSGTDVASPSTAVDNEQLAIAVGVAGSGTPTWPSNPTPSSGWTTDRSALSGTGNSMVAHQLFTASGTAQMQVRTNANAYLGVVMVVVGDPAGGGGPAAFVGWGIPIF